VSRLVPKNVLAALRKKLASAGHRPPGTRE
jgi:hypothetical protein